MIPSIFNPRMLVLAREALGITQGELADACGVSQSLVSKAEAGVLMPPTDRLHAMAEALEVLPEFFEQQHEVRGLGSPCLQFRRRQAVPAKKMREIVARVNMIRMQLEQLLRSAEITEQRFPPMDPDAFGDPEEIAQRIRLAWGLPHGPVHDLVRAIEDAGGVVVISDFGTSLFDAVSQWEPPMPPLFFVNVGLPGDRLRYTLAHELGHVIMQHHRLPKADAEEAANHFAAEFLVPRADVEHELGGVTLQRLAELKAYWKVSMQALLMRALHLGAITAQRYKLLIIKLGKLGYRRNEPVPIPAERPRTVQRILDVHIREHGYSAAELCRLVWLPHDRFDREFGGNPGKLRIVG